MKYLSIHLLPFISTIPIAHVINFDWNREGICISCNVCGEVKVTAGICFWLHTEDLEKGQILCSVGTEGNLSLCQYRASCGVDLICCEFHSIKFSAKVLCVLCRPIDPSTSTGVSLMAVFPWPMEPHVDRSALREIIVASGCGKALLEFAPRTPRGALTWHSCRFLL